jgi:hypothetical protein
MTALAPLEIDLAGAAGPIGWYAHHHGLGHLSRALAVAEHLPDVTIFSSRPGPGVQQLAIDVEPPRSAACAAQPDAVNLHYAPVGVDGVRTRMASLAMWVAAQDPALFVVDVSVEVATFMRLMSVPTVVVRQHGVRDDPAHRMGYANAQSLLAPYPQWLEAPDVPDWIVERTTHTGGFSRFDGRDPDQARARERLGVAAGDRLVVVLAGEGGRTGWPVGPAVRATPGWSWVLLGHGWGDLGGLTPTGWLEDPFDWLCAADVIVAHAGHNAVMEAAAARRPLVVIPVDRPHDEQRHKARALRTSGTAIVHPSWPDAGEWPALLAGAAEADPDMARALCDGQGARRAAHHLRRTAAVLGPQVAVG